MSTTHLPQHNTLLFSHFEASGCHYLGIYGVGQLLLILMVVLVVVVVVLTGGLGLGGAWSAGRGEVGGWEGPQGVRDEQFEVTRDLL